MIVLAAGVACVVAGAVLLVSTALPPAEFGPEAPAPAVAAAVPPVVDGSTDVGEELPRVTGTVPVEVSLPSRAVTAPVVPVSTGPRGGLVIPEPPSTVGWWSPGALVGGDSGRAVLAGHVDSRTGGLGAFAVLREMEAGEPVEVRGADGRVLRYVVTARRDFLKADLPPGLFAAGGPPGLVLITCGGRFDPDTGSYEDNIVVHAVPAPGAPDP